MFKQSTSNQQKVAAEKNTKGLSVQFRNAFAFLFLSLFLVSSGAQAADSTQPFQDPVLDKMIVATPSRHTNKMVAATWSSGSSLWLRRAGDLPKPSSRSI